MGGIRISVKRVQTLGRECRAGYRNSPPAPEVICQRNADAAETFKNTSPPSGGNRRGDRQRQSDFEIWFRLKPGSGRRTRSPRLAKVDRDRLSPTRPRTRSAYHLRSDLPSTEKPPALICLVRPYDMNQPPPTPLAEISDMLTNIAHGCPHHGSGWLAICREYLIRCLANYHLPLPPALAPTSIHGKENLWQFMRDNWLSNRVFKFLRRHCPPCLIRGENSRASLEIMSMRRRKWANGFWINGLGMIQFRMFWLGDLKAMMGPRQEAQSGCFTNFRLRSCSEG